MPLYIQNAPLATVTTYVADDGAQVFEATNGFLTVILEHDGMSVLAELRADLDEAGYSRKLYRYELAFWGADLPPSFSELVNLAPLWSNPLPWSVEHLPPRPEGVASREVRYSVGRAFGGFEVCLNEEQVVVIPHDNMGQPIADAAVWMTMDGDTPRGVDGLA